jgi:D-arabinose 1-dehydrogenase-like Zn-dependent alcohol dehydrogenase
MITLIGMVSGAKAEVNLPIVSMGSLRIHGIAVGSRQHLEQVLAACGTNGIRPVVDRVLPLADLAEAVRFVESGQQFGKVCVEI